MKNNMTKIILSCLLAFALILPMLLVGCTPEEGGGESSPADSSSETPAPTQPESSESVPESSSETETEPEPEPIKTDFDIYQSNSITPSGCNYALKSENGKPVQGTFRGIYKLQEFGELEYKFYFSNNVDSTFANGSHSYRNMPTEAYKIISATVGSTSSSFGTGKVNNIVTLTFDGKETRDVAAREMYWSDAVTVNVPRGQYLVFEWTVEYTVIAATNSEWVACPLFETVDGKLTAVQAAPMPALIGCNRGNDLRVAFIGDSITMGIGAGNYRFWASQVTELIGTDVSFWNLGLGYARADDAANSPAWLEKAKNNDVVVICFGVNDINSGPYKYSGQRNATQITNDIKTIAKTCADAGCEVIIFSTPPYTYGNSEKVTVWRALTKSLKTLAEDNGYGFFDFAALLGKPDDPSVPAYGGHPNAEGCRIVAEAFVASGLLKIPTKN